MAFLVAIGLAGGIYTTALTILPVSPGLLAEAPFLFRAWQAVDMIFWGWMVLIALGAATALSLMTRAYQLTQTSYAVIFEYVYLISAGFFSWLIWDIAPNMTSIAGILMIVMAGLVIIFAQIKAEAG